MKIHFALVDAARSRAADELGAQLADAVQRADFAVIDGLRKDLVSLTDRSVAIDVSEDVWRRIRARIPADILDESLNFVLHAPSIEAWRRAAEDEGEEGLAMWLAAALSKQATIFQFADGDS
jgi:hypothetical protein